MSKQLEQYASGSQPLPEKTLVWNMYGSGLESIGRENRPEALPIPKPGPDQMLVRVDTVGMCFSDVKLIKQGGNHPKLYNRDLAVEPTRLGHEASVTVIEVGENLRDQYQPGQRLAIQPDVYQNGRSTAYGYTVPGGLIQYHLIGPELLVTDAGACVLPLADQMGYAEAALLEPWGCVMAAYTQRRRLEPLDGGVMWMVGHPGIDQAAAYQFSRFLDRPAVIVLTDVPADLARLARQSGAEVVERNGVETDGIAALAAEFTTGGFDDIVVLDPHDSQRVGVIAQHIARRGTMNLVGQKPLDGLVSADVGRLHYDYIAFVGTHGSDIAASYGEARNRCELKADGVALFIGAGGPMGQMHVQRALELPDGPRVVIATDVNEERLTALTERFGSIAADHDRQLIVLNPTDPQQPSLQQVVEETTDGRGVDDAVVSVPVAPLMAEAAGMMNPDGMLVLFAGVPNGTMAPLDLSQVYLSNAQYTGTSGLTLDDQAQVMARAVAGSLSPGRSVAAIGGMNVVKEGLQAMMDGRYPGKIVIFPQFLDLPLLGLDELETELPAVAARLGPGQSWTLEAEDALFELMMNLPEASA